MMLEPSQAPKQKTNWLFVIFFFTGLIALYSLGTWVQYSIQEQEHEQYLVRRNTQRAQENQVLGEKIDAYAMPIIDAIERYKKENGKYPTDLAVLVPTYLTKAPKAVFGEKVVYSPEPNQFGNPFTFSFYGHYLGLASMHGWSYQYCPTSTCNIPDSLTHNYKKMHRINENWVFWHHSAL